MGDRPIGLITSTSVEEKWRWKDSVQSPEEIRMWMTDGMAHGLRPWFTKFNGKVPDNRWVAPIAETFRLHAQLEPELAPLDPTAEIAMLDPSTTLRSWHPDDREGAEAHELGLYHALVEARLPFDLLSDLDVSDAALDRYKLIAVANASFLSTAQCESLTALCRARRQPRHQLRDVALRRVRQAARRFRARQTVRRQRRRAKHSGR